MPALAVPNSLSARSFHPQQIPSWLVLPPIGVRFDRVARRSGGGDHGACHENGVVSDIDNEVGLWTLPAQRVNRPTSLEEVAAWFSALP
jgi:hypothetical protein